MEARKKRFEELDISRDELKTIGEALKTEEFRTLLADYCKEVSDPENQKIYQQEITELERQRGVDVTFINPDPGFVIKTSADGKQKAFINISKSPNVEKPAPGKRDERGFQWSIPYSIVPPREDLDHNHKTCVVVDVVFHPYTLYLAAMRKQFRDVVIQTALDAVEQYCHVSLDRSNLKFPKLKFKGVARGAVIRKKNDDYVINEEDKEFVDQIPDPYRDGSYFAGEKSKPHSNKVQVSKTPGYTAPKFDIKYRNYIDMQDFTYDVKNKANAAIPKELVIGIELPLLKSSSEPSLKLDITGISVSLICEKPKYKLNLTLPYAVDEDSGTAKFEKDTRKLMLTLPVVQPVHISKDIVLEDSGVESDPGGRPDDDADSDELPSKISEVPSEDDHHLEEYYCPSEVNDYGYRTSSNVQSTSICDKFLKGDVHYSLPPFTCNSFGNTFALTLHVKNVDEKTLNHRILGGKNGAHLSFASLGGGMFPQHFSLCFAFPKGSTVDDRSVIIETWDNNVVIQLQLEQSQGMPNEYYVGVDEQDLKLTPMTELLQVEMALNDLHERTENYVNNSILVEVERDSAEEVVVELITNVGQKPEPKVKALPPANTESDEKPDQDVKSETEGKVGRGSPTNNQRKGPAGKGGKRQPRGYSESSGDEWVQKQSVRGILKRPPRSLSESNLSWYANSDDVPSSAIGSEECIASENCDTCTEDHSTQKKTVRFSDQIGRKIFRVNSSILGKKNMKRKKRSRARRASEGDNSEGEIESLSGIMKNKSKYLRVKNDAKSPRVSESTEDEDPGSKRFESSEEEREKTDKENKVKKSRKRRQAKTAGRP